MQVPFTLVDQDGLSRHPTPEERSTLSCIFPGQKGFYVLGPFQVITVKSLPRDPWPAKMAGLPLYVTCSDFKIPWELGSPGNPRVLALEHLNAKLRPTREIYYAVIQYFENIPIDIHELIWITGSWRANISNTPTEMLLRLPGKICQIAVFYICSESAVLHQASVHRQEDPHQTIDNSSYMTSLRPGIMITSESTTTTSGVVVRNSSGKSYMTAALHGFVDGEINIHHPRETDQVIGRVEKTTQDTDIALVQLAPGVTYVNATFSSDVKPAGVLLRGYKDPYKLEPYATLSMDTPFTGTTNAMFLTVAVSRVPSDAGNEHIWISKPWSWLGQCHPPTDGCCGAAIWDSEGYVVGVFRFLLVENDGIGIGVAAEELSLRGYELLCQ